MQSGYTLAEGWRRVHEQWPSRLQIDTQWNASHFSMVPFVLKLAPRPASATNGF